MTEQALALAAAQDILRIIEDQRPDRARCRWRRPATWSQTLDGSSGFSAGTSVAREHSRVQRRGPPRVPHPGGRHLRRRRRTKRSMRRPSTSSRMRRPSGSRVWIGSPRPPAEASTSASTSRRRRTTLPGPARTLTASSRGSSRDFGLTDAIESGLVKIPQLAVADPDRGRSGRLLQHLALDHDQAHRSGERRPEGDHSSPRPYSGGPTRRSRSRR